MTEQPPGARQDGQEPGQLARPRDDASEPARSRREPPAGRVRAFTCTGLRTDDGSPVWGMITSLPGMP